MSPADEVNLDGGTAPSCTVVAGPNGAGKTTFALKYLPAIGCHDFINADMISEGLSPLAPESALVTAGKLFLREIAQRVRTRSDFGFETTLSGRGHLRLIRQMAQQGWLVRLVYLWLPSAEFSEDRVQERVRQGGHDIARDAIYRRFGRSIRNFVDDYAPVCSATLCYDNSNPVPTLIFRQSGSRIEVVDPVQYEAFMRCYHDR